MPPKIHEIDSFYFRIVVTETATAFEIDGASLSKATLARLFKHGRSDFAAFCDFLNGSWTWAHHPPQLVDTAPADLKRLVRDAHAAARSLLEKLNCSDFSHYCLLMEATAPHTSSARKNAA
jgi:hypothetical protein